MTTRLSLRASAPLAGLVLTCGWLSACELIGFDGAPTAPPLPPGTSGTPGASGASATSGALTAATSAEVTASSGSAGSSGGVVVASGSGAASNATSAPPGCVTDRQFYTAQVTPLSDGICIACHVEGGRAGNTAFRLVPQVDDAAADANMAAFAGIAARTMVGPPDFVLKPTQRVAHGGGQLIVPGGPEATMLEQWANRLRQPGACSNPGPITCEQLSDTYRPDSAVVALPLRRLTPAHYAQTLASVFGAGVIPSASYPLASSAELFTSFADANAMSLPSARALMEAAEDVALQVLEVRSDLIPCALASGDRLCAEELIITLGEQLHRRPVTPQDATRFLALFDAASARPFDERIASVLSAMLQAPAFLYHLEGGTDVAGAPGVIQLDDYAIAARLSYLLWDSPPDDLLLQAAAANAVHTPQEIQAQANRLFSDQARSRTPVLRFFREWLLGDIPRTTQQKAGDPEFRDNAPDFLEEFDRSIWALVQRNAPLSDLFTSPVGFVNPNLAALLQMAYPGAGTGWEEVDFSLSGRLGMMTRPALIAFTARADSTSAIYLGKFVRQRLLCQEMPMPPVGATTTELPGNTPREKSISRINDPVCGSCHRLMDPVGWAFESFNANGLSVTVDPQLTAGTLEGADEVSGTFTSLSALTQRLAASRMVRECAARHAVAFALARHVDTLDGCVQQAVVDRLGQTPLLRDLVLTAVTHPGFTMRRVTSSGGTP